MRAKASIAAVPPDSKLPGGSQTLMRGLDIIEALAGGGLSLAELAQNVDLTQSTAYRLAAALVERGYLVATPRAGYRLGPKLIELGHSAQLAADLIKVIRPHIEALAAATEDTVHLGVLDHGRARYLDKIDGRRRINISSRVGELHPLTSTGLGKALILDHTADQWREQLVMETAVRPHRIEAATWMKHMRNYVAQGCTFDLEENEDMIRCVAAPIRDAAGQIVAAISVSSARPYMDDARMAALSDSVRACGNAASRELGWSPKAPSAGKRRGRTE